MTRIGQGRLWLALALTTCLSMGPVALAQKSLDPQVTRIQLGFDGYYKVGYWTPLELHITGGGEPITGSVAVTLPDGDGARSTVVSERPYQLLPGRSTRVLTYVKPGRADADISVRFVRLPSEGGDTVLDERFDLRAEPDALHPRQGMLSSQTLIVSLGPSIGVDAAVAARNANFGVDGETVVVQLSSIEQLPTRWYGYEGVDRLVIATSDPAPLEALNTTGAQYAALLEWMRLGGKLLVSAGSRAETVLGAGSPLAEFLPGRLVGMAELRPARAFETYVSATDPLPQARGADARLQAPKIADARGLVEVQEGQELPLVVRSPYGFGEVTFVGVDLDLAPFSRWTQRGRLVGKLLGFNEPAATSNPSRQANLMGYNDLAGQLRAALDQFTGIKIAPFYLVALLIAGYIVLIGPFDYWLVKKVLKRMEWTWFTFPLMVLLVTGGAYVMAYWMKGDSLLVNQVDVVDVDLASQRAEPLARGSSYINVFSPQMRSYDISVTPKPQWPAPWQGGRQIVSWMGLPGAGFGGMNQATADPPLFTRSYRFTPDLSALERVPIQVWSTKSFAARWNADLPDLAGAVTADLRSVGSDELEGQITHHLNVKLTDCLLAYGNSAYRLGTLDPGSELQLNPRERRRLRDELIERRGYVSPNPGNVVVTRRGTQWDISRTDLVPVVEQMMFFSATGAEETTNLENQYQSFLDLSDHLRMGQAAFIGRADGAAAPLELNGGPVENDGNRQATIYRFLLPVARKP